MNVPVARKDTRVGQSIRVPAPANEGAAFRVTRHRVASYHRPTHRRVSRPNPVKTATPSSDATRTEANSSGAWARAW